MLQLFVDFPCLLLPALHCGRRSLMRPPTAYASSSLAPRSFPVVSTQVEVHESGLVGCLPDALWRAATRDEGWPDTVSGEVAKSLEIAHHVGCRCSSSSFKPVTG